MAVTVKVAVTGRAEIAAASFAEVKALPPQPRAAPVPVVLPPEAAD